MNLPPSVLKVLGVIVKAAQQNQTLTVREISKRLGYSSTNAVFQILKRLRAAGLVSQLHAEKFASGRTIRPTCRVVLIENPGENP